MNKWGSRGVKGIKFGYKGQFLSFEMNSLNKNNLSLWLVRCWLYWVNSNQYINQTRYVLFTCVADLVWSDLWSQIANALFGQILIWIVFVRRFIRSESLQNITGDRAVELSEGQFIGNDRVRIWLEKNGLLVGDNINVNQNIGTRH